MHPQPSGTRLDPWYGSYSARTHEMKASEIRALFAVANRPEVVSLAGGMPNIADLPMDSFADAVAQLLRTQGARALQYGSGQGDPELRSQISEIMALEAINAHPDDVVVTTGSPCASVCRMETFQCCVERLVRTGVACTVKGPVDNAPA